MIVGYYRRLPREQGSPPDAAGEILRLERCMRIDVENGTGNGVLKRLIASLGSGDVLVSPSIDQLAGSLRDILFIAEQLHKRFATLRLVAENVDTALPGARHAVNALAEYERRSLDRRQRAGLAEAEQRGAHPGRPRKIAADQIAYVRDQLALGRSFASLAREMDVHPTTVMRLATRIADK